ncbi:MAG: hypothetical protein M0P11_08260 [Anaerolineaceae bacterium]|jgi:hypothetical protein|nr:hypothetical protein [Anaerolineaceae bacterium]
MEPKETEAKLLKTLDSLQASDRIGVAGKAMSTALAAGGGLAASGTVASVAGASTILGSSTLGSLLGGVFVASTPVGWVIGSAIAAGAAGYALTKLVSNGAKQDVARERHRQVISERLHTLHDSGDMKYDDFSERLNTALQKKLISRDNAQKLFKLVNGGQMPLRVAIVRLDRIIQTPNPSIP